MNKTNLTKIFAIVITLSLLIPNGLMVRLEKAEALIEIDNPQVLCHFNEETDKYESYTVPGNAGADGHDSHEKDIIPEYDYISSIDTGHDCKLKIESWKGSQSHGSGQNISGSLNSSSTITGNKNKIEVVLPYPSKVNVVYLEVEEQDLQGNKSEKDYAFECREGCILVPKEGGKFTNIKWKLQEVKGFYYSCHYPGKNWEEGQGVWGAGCVEQPEKNVTIIVHKIVCESEEYLPNWGLGGDDIDEYTVGNFLNTINYQGEREVCWLESGWDFQWGNSSVADPGRNHLGEAEGDWNTFGTTDENGMTSVVILESEITNPLKLREVLQSGYIPFTYDNDNPSNENDHSAEFYCHDDVFNYDNFDYINNPEPGETYYCVAFNALEESESGSEPECGNNEIEEGEECDGEDGITEGKNFCTNTCRLIPIYNGEHSCPEGTSLGDEPIFKVEISSQDKDGELITGLEPGHYLFKASGEYFYSGEEEDKKADAGYGTRDNWESQRSDVGIKEGVEHRGVLSLLSDMGTSTMGVVNWGVYNSDHVYYKAHKVEDGVESVDIRFVISDWYSSWYDSLYKNQGAMDDNLGGLTLEVYRCVESSPQETPSTGGGGGGGGGITGSSAQEASGEGSLGEPGPGEGIVAGAACIPYLHEYIQYGANNDPFEVRKLQIFLNGYLGLNLDVNGIYDLETFNAVKTFQTMLKDDILAPWVVNGCLSSEELATGYVYRTTRWAINNIFCPEMRPDVSDETCFGFGEGLVLGESIALADDGSMPEGDVLDTPVSSEQEPEEEVMEISEIEDIETTEPGETEEEAKTNQGAIIALLAVLALGGLAYFIFRGKRV